MKVVVPDASIILKWVLGKNEEGQDKAKELLQEWVVGEHDFILPSLWSFEVGNILGLKRPDDAEKLMELLIEYKFKEHQMTKELAVESFELMNNYKGITFYDAVYHAVALENNGVLVTADKSYFKKVKETGKIILI